MKLARDNSQARILNLASPARILSPASSLVSRKGTILRGNPVSRNPENSPVSSQENQVSNQVKIRASSRGNNLANSPGRTPDNNRDSSLVRLPVSQATILRASHPVHLNLDSSRGSGLNPVNEADRVSAVSLSRARSRRKVSRAAISQD